MLEVIVSVLSIFMAMALLTPVAVRAGEIIANAASVVSHQTLQSPPSSSEEPTHTDEGS